MKRLWSFALDWFEHGDLVPLLIVVSAAHYSAVLAGKDNIVVAVLIGVLVDLGHYRWVRAAARYDGNKIPQYVIRWGFTILLTGLSLLYHQRYYQDWLLSIPIPLLIASLAWLTKVDARQGASAKTKQVPPEYVPVVVEAHTEHMQDDPEHMQIVPEFVCASCNEPFESRQKYAAHMRWAHRNGHEKEQVKL